MNRKLFSKYRKPQILSDETLEAIKEVRQEKLERTREIAKMIREAKGYEPP